MEEKTNELGKFYDKEGIYDGQIAPLVNKIIKICQKHGMSLIISVAFAEHSDGRVSIADTVIPAGERTPYIHRLFGNIMENPRTAFLLEFLVSHHENDSKIARVG